MPVPPRRAMRTALRVVLGAARPSGRRDGALTTAAIGLAVTAERAGLDACFVTRGAGLDPYVLLASMAAATSRVELGCLATPPGERPPAMLAKVAASLDVCSDGRAVLGLGAPLTGAPGESSAVLGDHLEICRAMVRVPGPSYHGEAATIVGAWNEPRVPGAPLPLALLIPTMSGRDGLDAVLPLLVLAARLAELCCVEVGDAMPGDGATGLWELPALFDRATLAGGRAPGSVHLVAVFPLDADGSSDPSAERVLARAAAWRGAGYDGVVIDVPAASGAPGAPGRLARVLEGLATLDA